MTNFEIYKDDLMKIKGSFAVDKNSKKIVGCRDSADGIEEYIDCEDCLFNNTQYCFETDKIKWLYKEYEPPVLSDDELELIKALGKATKKEYKYVVRDACGVMRFFETKPHVNKSGNYYGEYTYADIASGDKVLFPNITHKDGLYDIENKCFIKEERED